MKGYKEGQLCVLVLRRYDYDVFHICASIIGEKLTNEENRMIDE